MTTTSKPQEPPIIDLSSTGVSVLSPLPPNDTDIVIAGDDLYLRLHLAITGIPLITGMWASEKVEITHHVEEIHTGARKTLGPFAFTTPAPAGLANFEFTTGPFTTSVNGGGGTFETAAGDDDGVYRVVTEFHFTKNNAVKADSVFNDRILAITKG